MLLASSNVEAKNHFLRKIAEATILKVFDPHEMVQMISITREDMEMKVLSLGS